MFIHTHYTYNRFELTVCCHDEHNIHKSMYGLPTEHIDEIGLTLSEIKMTSLHHNCLETNNVQV